jgi:hypothetical protein
MTYRSLAAVGVSIILISANGRANAGDAAPSSKKSGTTKGDSAEAEWAADAKAGDASDTDESAPKAKPKSKPVVVEEAAPAPAADAPPPAPPETAELGPAPERPAIYGKRSQWFFAPYGYARLDAIEDSTESFEDGIQPNLIARAGTYKGDHRRTIMTARDSRLGLFVGAPTYRNIRTSSQVEFDFYGLVPTDARRHDSVVFGPLRIRLAYFKLETAIVDIIAGQYYDLFGWNSYFYPATVGYLGVPGQIYHRNPQLRIEKKLHLGQVEVLAAIAAVRPGERDSGLPEGQAGLKLAYGGWAGAATPGFGRPALQPLSVGVSGIYRAFETPVFRSEPGSASQKTYGYGMAASMLLPIIPIKAVEDRGNSLTLTGEYSIGTGIADMYTFMDGGSRFPLLPNPSTLMPVTWPANVDPGLVTFDRNLNLKTINWQAIVGGAQYYLPIDKGRIMISGLYSRIWSNNIKDLTPFPSWGGIFTKMEYFDANVSFDITPAAVLGLSFQSVRQTFGDVSAPTPNYDVIHGDSVGQGLGMPNTGGVAAHARNDRGQLSMSFFF